MHQMKIRRSYFYYSYYQSHITLYTLFSWRCWKRRFHDHSCLRAARAERHWCHAEICTTANTRMHLAGSARHCSLAALWQTQRHRRHRWIWQFIFLSFIKHWAHCRNIYSSVWLNEATAARGRASQQARMQISAWHRRFRNVGQPKLIPALRLTPLSPQPYAAAQVI